MGNNDVLDSSINLMADDALIADDAPIWDLPDDVMRVVFSFLNPIHVIHDIQLVCKRWRVIISRGQDLWSYLDFENQPISAEQFKAVCLLCPKAAGMNVYGTPYSSTIGSNSMNLLGNLEVLTIGGGLLPDSYFQDLTLCWTLRSLTIKDASFGYEASQLRIYHARLRNLRILDSKICPLLVRCRNLEILSLEHTEVPYVIGVVRSKSVLALNCPLLRALDVASCGWLTNDNICSVARFCPLLEFLDVSNCSQVSDKMLETISCPNLRAFHASLYPNNALENMILQNLTVLKLHNCKGISSDSMAAVALSDMLEVLEFDNCNSLTSLSLDLAHLRNIKIVLCRNFVELDIRSNMLPSVTVLDCPSLQTINLTSHALEESVLQNQTSAFRSPSLQELTDCELSTDCVFKIYSNRQGRPALRSSVVFNFKRLTAVSFTSTCLRSLTISSCRALTTLHLSCPNLDHFSLEECNLERATFSPVSLRSLNLGPCAKLNVLHLRAPEMVLLKLKGCGALSEAFVDCPRLKFLDTSFCSQFKDDILSAIASSCPIESLKLTSCHAIGPEGLSSLRSLLNLTYLDLSYTYLENLQPVFDSCLYLKVLKLQGCKFLMNSSMEPLYKSNALPDLRELYLSYVELCQSAIEELLNCCGRLTHISLNGCPNITKVTMAECIHLTLLNLSSCVNLEEVDLSCCNLLTLNLNGCSSLERLNLNCPKLTTLLLQSGSFSAEAIEAVVMQCNMLQALDIRSCPKIRPSSVERLRAVCRNLKHVKQ